MSVYSLDLDDPALVRNGIEVISFDTSKLDFAAEVRRLLVDKGFTNAECELVDLHKFVSQEDQRVDIHLLNNVTKAFYETSTAFREFYLGLIAQLASSSLTGDFLFQETPTIRFHFPAPLPDQFRDRTGRYLGHHNDGMLGHSHDEINCWLPLTDCRGSAALEMVDFDTSIAALREFFSWVNNDAEMYSRKGRGLFFELLTTDESYGSRIIDACRPLPMRYGELLVFDSRCLHSPAENIGDETRISFDFRIIPLERYEHRTHEFRSAGRSGRSFSRGDIYAMKSGRELLGERAAESQMTQALAGVKE